MLPIKIAGLGYYLPERRVTNAELEARCDVSATWIERATGVQERRYATHETSAGMGAAAARRALDAAAVRVDDLDAIIGASTGPQQAIPCTAALVQRELSAPDGKSVCFDINATCLSFMFGLHTAAQLVASGMYRNVLVYSSEITSRSLNLHQPESMVLFGDAAAAAVVTRSAPGEDSALWHAQFATHSSGADLTQIRGGGTQQHPNNPTTTPEMNTFQMNGKAIFKHAARLIGPFLDQFFDRLGWQRDDLNVIVPHQASRHAVDLLTGRLGFRDDQVVQNLALRGNCIAASLPLALAEADAAGRIRRGDKMLLVGSGAGLTLGALALTY
jgi:3-oxoacyl-[acyl-carrier-protein] synthase III